MSMLSMYVYVVYVCLGAFGKKPHSQSEECGFESHCQWGVFLVWALASLSLHIASEASDNPGDRLTSTSFHGSTFPFS